MSLTDKISLVNQAHFDLLDSRKIALGLADVFYGDQALIPRTPTVCVDAGSMDRDLNGVSAKGTTENTFRIYHLIYVGKVQDAQLNLKQSQQLAEAIMDVLHEDITMGGLVLHGYVRTIEPGYVRKRDGILKVERLSWQGMNKTRIV